MIAASQAAANAALSALLSSALPSPTAPNIDGEKAGTQLGAEKKHSGNEVHSGEKRSGVVAVVGPLPFHLQM